MADLRGIVSLRREGEINDMLGKDIRMARVLDPIKKRAVVIAYAHGALMGPTPGIVTLEENRHKIVEFTRGGASSVLMMAAYAKLCGDLFVGPGKPSLGLCLEWSNMWRPETLLGYRNQSGFTVNVLTVEEAVHLGADYVHTYLFLGAGDAAKEAREIQRNAEIVRECNRYGMPLMIEPMARGEKVGANIHDPAYIALAVRIAAELGSDMVKTAYTGTAESFRSVVEACPVPVLIAGGPRVSTGLEVLEMVEGAIRAGAAGVVFGRNVFQASNSERMTQAICRIVFEEATAAEAVPTSA